MELIGFVFFKVNVEQCPFKSNRLGKFFDSVLVSSQVPKQKKPLLSHHLVGKVLALIQMRIAAGEFG